MLQQRTMLDAVAALVLSACAVVCPPSRGRPEALDFARYSTLAAGAGRPVQ